MKVQDYKKAAELLKVLGHPARLCIVHGLLEFEGCNVSYMQHCLNIPQSTVSQHIAKLKAAKIIEGERDGLEIKYRVINEQAKELMCTLFSETKEL